MSISGHSHRLQVTKADIVGLFLVRDLSMLETSALTFTEVFDVGFGFPTELYRSLPILVAFLPGVGSVSMTVIFRQRIRRSTNQLRLMSELKWR